MLISQIKNDQGGISVVVRNGAEASIIQGVESSYALVRKAIAAKTSIANCVREHTLGPAVDLEVLAEQNRILLPIHHDDPAHMHLTGTGLTHLGSASTRDAMHNKNAADTSEMTDSMRMFQMGLESGKPAAGKVGVQPEWFYKGNGTAAVAPGHALKSPAFADDGGEEPEIAGVYVVGDTGTVHRVGFALSNEFSDHVMERVNYLYLAHSKLREASFGPEIFVGELPADIRGTSSIVRNGKTIWSKPFLSGEDNMSHTIANLEHHHFKYELFRQPGDIHVHMFGTATLSFADKIACEDGDEFVISAPEFGMPLRNPLQLPRKSETLTTVEVL
ncbi:AraD1 family protein [Ahrensia marina]|uniref:GguC protein n=1 Tax=Ahrensia marina TaxID=1514904 RepID=A0A0M9GP25_9HYPH|nr:AraD1 family protein [Ahrensia marina]KPB02323.1 GguC protein [Ahrensia marina]